jgi:hypothetical protein
MRIAHAHVEPFHQRRQQANTEPRPGLALRVRVRWNALALDSALADGANPEGSEELRLRARQLADPVNRERLAKSMERILELADRESASDPTMTRVPLRRQPIEVSRPRLAEVVELLRADGERPARGLARASLLIEDGRGPLYVDDTPDGLEKAVDRTLAALNR